MKLFNSATTVGIEMTAAEKELAMAAIGLIAAATETALSAKFAACIYGLADKAARASRASHGGKKLGLAVSTLAVDAVLLSAWAATAENTKNVVKAGSNLRDAIVAKSAELKAEAESAEW